MKLGIYQIRCLVNDKIYIGQSANLKERQQGHWQLLRRGKHPNRHLQSSFIKHGEERFVFEVIEECDIALLTERETYHLAQHDSLRLYNYMLVAEEPDRSFRHCDETKQKMSALKEGKYDGCKNPNWGKRNTLETKVKMSVGRGKLTAEDVVKIKDRLLNGETHQAIADDFNIARTAITRIANGTRWTNVTGGPVHPVQRTESGKRVLRDSHLKRIGRQKGLKHTEQTRQKMSESRKRYLQEKGE